MKNEQQAKEIGNRIRIKREKMGMTQEQLASKLGYKSKSSITKIENGTRDLRQKNIKAIADALDTTPSYLMGWDDEEASNTTSDEFYVKLGIALKKAREKAKMTQQEVADKMGVSKVSVFYYEKGERKMYASVLKDYCKAVGVTVQSIFDKL